MLAPFPALLQNLLTLPVPLSLSLALPLALALPPARFLLALPEPFPYTPVLT